MINETENQPMQFLVDNESEWFDKLITFVWCQFDSNIDVCVFILDFSTNK